MTITRRQRTGLIFIAFVLLIIVISKVLSAPEHGKPVAVEKSQVKTFVKPKQTVAPASTDEQQYFTLSLPPGFVQQGSQRPGGNILFSQTIIKAGSFGSTLINIGIQNVPEGGLDADPSYHLRTIQTDRYSLSHTTVKGDSIAIANDLQSAVVVAFWVHGAHFATISVSQGIGNPATDDNQEVIKVLNQLLGVWSWK